MSHRCGKTCLRKQEKPRKFDTCTATDNAKKAAHRAFIGKENARAARSIRLLEKRAAEDEALRQRRREASERMAAEMERLKNANGFDCGGDDPTCPIHGGDCMNGRPWLAVVPRNTRIGQGRRGDRYNDGHHQHNPPDYPNLTHQGCPRHTAYATPSPPHPVPQPAGQYQTSQGQQGNGQPAPISLS